MISYVYPESPSAECHTRSSSAALAHYSMAVLSRTDSANQLSTDTVSYVQLAPEVHAVTQIAPSHDLFLQA
jgi:hypothetical protein